MIDRPAVIIKKQIIPAFKQAAESHSADEKDSGGGREEKSLLEVWGDASIS